MIGQPAPRRLLWSALCATTLAFLAPVEDLEKRYKPTLDENAPSRPIEWSASFKDVWQLKSFELERSDKLKLSFGESTVVFGTKDSNAIWAMVVPAKATPLAGSLAEKDQVVTSVLLRFNPRRVGDLFPAKTVGKSGPPEALLWARRVVAHRLTQTGWYWDAWPTLMKRGEIVADCEIEGGARRVFDIDTEKGTVEIDKRFTKSELPPSVPLEKAKSVEAFDKAWKEFDKTYAKFQLRPEVDWDALYKQYKPLAERSKTTWETAASIALLVEHLRDLHVHVKCKDEWMPQYWRYRVQNGVMLAAKSLIGELSGNDEVRWARASDGIGYVRVNGVGSEEVPKQVDAALDKLADTWGLIVDIRFNGGGGTDIAAAVAGRFVDREHVYANSQFRSGTSKRTQLTELKPRTVAPRGPWRYEAPVMVLLGQRCMSSGEELALMLAQCPQVTTMGDRTAGSSAAPMSLELEGGITVNVPRWNDCDAAGKPYEDIGVPPKIPIAAEPEAFSMTKDPVIEAALAQLRKVAEKDRKAGKR